MLNLKRYGSDYGGWKIDDSEINKNSIIYSFGIGEDASFDLELINTFGCLIHAYDPTPKSKKWVNDNILNSNFKFSPIGLSNINGTEIFFYPSNENYVSFSKFGNTDKIELPVSTLDTLMKVNDHTEIDILKMDIEGFEYEVLFDILTKGIKIKQICVEFHLVDKNKDILNAINEKYDLISQKNSHDFTFKIK